MPKLVVDANRIISALLKDGTTRAALLETRARLFAPESLLEEISRHAPEIAKRIGISEGNLQFILRPLLNRIEWVPEAVYRPHLKTAKAAIGGVDPGDVTYLACALAIEADAIWSHDLDFDCQQLVPRIPPPDARVR